MPAAQRVLKDIYQFKNVDELQSSANDAANLKNLILGFMRVIANGDKLYDNAILKYKEGDEELAYVYFMRAIQLYQNARQCRDYKEKNDKKYWSSMCGTKLKDAIEKCEELFSSLTRRYSILHEINQVQLKEKAAELDELKNKQYNASGIETTDKTTIPPAADSKEKNYSLTLIDAKQKIVDEPEKFITCEKLYQILSSTKINESFLILDIRPSEEYDDSKIKSPHCINIPSELFKNGVIATKIESGLKPADRIEFRRRHDVDYVILVDWNAGISDINEQGRLLRILSDALYQYDNMPLKRPPVVLEDGFHSFINSYPTLTTDPLYRRREAAGSDFVPSSDNGSSESQPWYPDIDKILRTWKQQQNLPPNRPQSPKIEKQRPSTPPGTVVTSKQPTMPDRKLKPSSATVRPSIPAPMDSDSTPDTEFDHAISVSKQIDMQHHITGIGQKLLDAGRIASKIVVGGDTVSTDDDSEAIIEAKEEMDKEHLREKVSDSEMIMKAHKDKIDELAAELRKVKPKKPVQSTSTSTSTDVSSTIDVQVETMNREIDLLQADLERVRKERDETKKQLELQNEVTRLRKERKMKENRRSPPAILKQNGFEPSAANDLDDDSDAQHPAEDESPQEDYTAQLRRSHSSPNVPKLLARENDEPPKQPQIPDRNTKPSFRSYEQSYQQEGDYFKKALDNMRVVSGVVGRGLTGMQNLGSSCYMNSTVQCLSNTKALREYFLNYDYRRDINYTNILGSKGEVARNFAVLLNALWMGKYRYIVPRDFKIAIGNVAETFRNHEQQDAQEFMVFLLDGLHEDLNKVKVRERIGEQDNNNVELHVAANRAWQDHLKLNNSVIVDRFQGQFLSVISCTICKTKSSVFDVLMYLSLPLPSKEEANECSLETCFKKFLLPERMCDDGMWFCPKCKQKREAYKQFVIWKLPKILIIHFKRFTRRGRWHEKLETMVNFPLQLNMESYVYGERPENQYSLYAVVNHYGTMEGGHYTSVCKNGSSWYEYDDEVVKEISQGAVKTRAAYILFYTSSS